MNNEQIIDDETFAESVKDNIVLNDAKQSIKFGEEFENINSLSDKLQFKNIELINDFYNSPLNSKIETVVKKIFAASSIIARDKGMFDEIKGLSNESICSLVDDSLTRSKLAYKTAIGEMEDYEAIDAAIDRAAARTSAFLEKYIPSIGEKVGEFVANSIVKVFPPAIVLKPFIKEIISVGSKKIANKTSDGVMIIANKAKSIAHKVMDKEKNMLNKFISLPSI